MHNHAVAAIDGVVLVEASVHDEVIAAHVMLLLCMPLGVGAGSDVPHHAPRPRSCLSKSWYGPRTGFSAGNGTGAAYPTGVRRSSQLAAEISSVLTRAGVTVSARRLEGWSLDGLGADERLSVDEQVAHYLALEKVAGPGRGRNADVAARRLAAHGFVCKRLRGALLRGLNIAEVGQPETPIDLSTDESADAAFEHLDEIARAMSGSIGQIPLPMRQVVEKARRNAYDIARRAGEPGDNVFRSAIVNLLCLLFGGELYDAQPIAALVGLEPEEVDPAAVEFVNQRLRITSWDLDEAYRSAPLLQVATMAAWMRERAHLAVAFLGLETATEAQLDDLATTFAPYALYILVVIVPRFDDAGEILATLGLPAVLVPPELGASALSA